MPKYKKVPAFAVKAAAYKERYDMLCAAVRQLYFSANWVADRAVGNECQLWENLRDLAGIPEGHSREILGLMNEGYRKE